MWVLSRRVGWNDDLAAALGQPVPQPSRVIGPVCQEAARSGDAPEKFGDTGQVVRLARRQTERDRSSNLVRQGMNLGRPSAARAPDRMGILPPFAPLAERCALMEVLSALVVPITPEDPDKT